MTTALEALADWEDRQDGDVPSMELSSPDHTRWLVARNHTPAIGTSGRKITTVQGLVTEYAYLADCYAAQLRETERTREALRQQTEDIAAFRRVLGTN